MLFDRIIDERLLVRRVNISANHVIPEASAPKAASYEQLDLFTDYAALEKQQAASRLEREEMQKSILDIKKKFGKNNPQGYESARRGHHQGSQ